MIRPLVERWFARLRPHFAPGGRYHRLWPIFEGAESIVLRTRATTTRGAHIRDPMDMKRLMIFVVFAILPCLLAGTWSIGHEAYLYEGLADPPVLKCLLRGAWYMLPIVLVSYVVGGAWEILFAVVRGHDFNEGFLVTGILFPLTLAPTTPLWMVALGIGFGVVIGKEVFGGVGMNILNPALVGRAFVFFAYPAVISGAKVWDVVGLDNPLAHRFAAAPVDSYTGATPLLAVATAPRGADAVATLHAAGWTWSDLFLGRIPGSMGEVSALAALLGALFLVLAGLASWRIMAGCLLGLIAMASLDYWVLAGPHTPALMSLPPWYHLVMGGFAFGAAFMATDPVSGCTTLPGQWLYGLLIGVLTVLIRVFNPAYPEGVMLAILLMNVFAPLIDYLVVRRSTRARTRRLAATEAP